MSDNYLDFNENLSSVFCRISEINIPNIQVFNLNDLYGADEEVIICLSNKNDGLLTVQTGQDLFLKEKSTIGQKDFHDIQVPDRYMGLTYYQLDYTKWFRKTMVWVKEYSLLLRIKKLPMSLYRHIGEFLKEPRCITFTDFGSSNGSLLALKPDIMREILEGHSFRLGERLNMVVEKKDKIRLNGNEALEDLQNKIQGVIGPGEMHIVIYDYQRTEEEKNEEGEDNKTCHVLCLQFDSKDYRKIVKNCIIASNKQHVRYLVGSSLDANIRFDDECVDQFQCEIVLEKGRWYVNEWPHQEKKKQTWFKITTPRNKEFKIRQDTEIMIGRTTLQIIFPNKLFDNKTKESFISYLQDFYKVE